MRITNVQRFCTHDGPGIRTTVFLKGCPLRCAWCHNPETQTATPEILYYGRRCLACGACAAVCPQSAHELTASGHTFDREKCVSCGACAAVCPAKALELDAVERSVEDIFAEIRRDQPFFGQTGGLTVSGGEPLMQGDETVALLKLAKEAGIGTAVETCGWFEESLIPDLADCADLLLYDIKDTDPLRHEKNTGVRPEKIWKNLRLADEAGIASLLRCVMVWGENVHDEHADKLAALAKSLSHCRGVELMPYHAFGGSKNEALGRGDNGRTEWIPPKDALENFRERLRAKGVRVIENK